MEGSLWKWSDSLFLPDTLVWDLETKGIICDPDDVESEDQVSYHLPTAPNLSFG